ncbi:uncharacterized protein LOC132721790 [Ruditapes philippinarum]|uniref:uncharacterized protein LOC132721790 n=1 Tax=Ruditapes philippinarum TaxID=129788 RepID=UPI00295A6FA9|nr:uncharacterized protein LOC132721790 [Ruditapes philippinarum]
MISGTNFLSIVFMMWHIDARIITYQTGVDFVDDYYECGEKLVLSCKIDRYQYSMSWQNDSSDVPFAQCVNDVCTLDHGVADKFVFSTDTSTGTFNLTFVVSIYNNGTKYTCSDGSTKYSTLVLTKDYRPTLKKIAQGQLKAMSGCVNPTISVKFFWKIVQAVTMIETYFSPTYVDDYQAINKKACELDVECGVIDSIQHVRSIEAEPGGSKDYFLKVIVSYDGFTVESSPTDETYKIGASKRTTIRNATNGPAVFVTETTPLATEFMSNYTQTTSIHKHDSQNQSDMKYIPLFIGGGIILLILCLTVLICIYLCRRHYQY